MPPAVFAAAGLQAHERRADQVPALQACHDAPEPGSQARAHAGEAAGGAENGRSRDLSHPGAARPARITPALIRPAPGFGIIAGPMQTHPPPHLLIVDDHAMVRSGLAQLLRTLRDPCEVSEAADLPQARAALAARPDIALVVLDVHLPDEPPLAPLRELRRSHPLLPVLLMSGDTDPLLAARALDEGAAGWLPKSADAPVLLNALDQVLAGGSYVPPFLLQRPALPPEVLTDRQLEVLAQLVRGRSNKEIARQLGMAEPTVKGHLVTIFRVLRVRNRAEAALAGQAHLRATGRAV